MACQTFIINRLPPCNTDNYYEMSAKEDDLTDKFTSVFIRLTMSNIAPGSPLMWVHFSMVYAFVGWTCWLTIEYYKEYIAIRQAYLVNVRPCGKAVAFAQGQ